MVTEKCTADHFNWRDLEKISFEQPEWDARLFERSRPGWLALETISVRRPEWETEPLEWFQDLLSGRLHRALPSLSAMPTHHWSSDASDFKTIYGDIDSPDHAFGAEPLVWGFRLTEPQITKGWEYFLNGKDAGMDAHRRSAAFLMALSDLSDTAFCKLEDLRDCRIKVKAEHHFRVERDPQDPKPKRRRLIDLFIMWRKPDTKTQIAAIEFKLEHCVTPDQLLDTEDHVNNLPEKQSGLMFLIAPSKAAHMRAGSKNPNWHLTSWHAFLRRYEINLGAAGAGDHENEFRRFRKTVFNRTMRSNHV